MPNVCVLCVKPLLKYPSPRISYHVFPTCPKKRQIWLKQCRLKNQDVLRHHKICSFHFEPTCFKPNVKRRILYSDAVPTIFGNGRVKTKNQSLKTVKGKPKNCNKKEIAGQNRQSRNASLTKATKKGTATSNRISRNVLKTKPAVKVFDHVKSNATNQKRKLDKLDEPIRNVMKSKSSFLSIFQLARIQFSLTNGIE